MTLLVISLYEFKQFLQIIMWIGLPATLIIVIITTILHYRRKNQVAMEAPVQYQSLPSNTGMEMASSSEAYQNMMHLQKKYIGEIEVHHQEHSVLKEEFKKLEKKYIELIAKNGTQPKSNHNSTVFQDAFQQKENEVLQLKALLLQMEETLRSEKEQKKLHSAEINKLGTLLKDTEMAATKARQELEDRHNSFERQLEEIKGKHATEKKAWLVDLDRLNQEFIAHKEENSRLRGRLVEQESAHDVIEEKNIQIGFLQNQLDNRIKNFHHLEYQNQEDENRVKDLETFAVNSATEIRLMKEELQFKADESFQFQERVGILQEQINAAIAQQESLTGSLQVKSSHIDYIEQELKDFEDRNNQAMEQLNNSQIIILQLNENLKRAAERSAELEKKLELSNQLLKKIYKELSSSFSTNVNADHEEESLIGAKNSNEQDFTEPINLSFDLSKDKSLQFQD
jgi:hypothetical protein